MALACPDWGTSALSSLKVWVKVLISVLRCRTHATLTTPLLRIEGVLG